MVIYSINYSGNNWCLLEKPCEYSVCSILISGICKKEMGPEHAKMIQIALTAVSNTRNHQHFTSLSALHPMVSQSVVPWFCCQWKKVSIHAHPSILNSTNLNWWMTLWAMMTLWQTKTLSMYLNTNVIWWWGTRVLRSKATVLHPPSFTLNCSPMESHQTN